MKPLAALDRIGLHEAIEIHWMADCYQAEYVIHDGSKVLFYREGETAYEALVALAEAINGGGL